VLGLAFANDWKHIPLQFVRGPTAGDDA